MTSINNYYANALSNAFAAGVLPVWFTAPQPLKGYLQSLQL